MLTQQQAQLLKKASQALNCFAEVIPSVRGHVHPHYAPWQPWTPDALKELAIKLDILATGETEKHGHSH
jgi:hypothetical protein